MEPPMVYQTRAYVGIYSNASISSTRKCKEKHYAGLDKILFPPLALRGRVLSETIRALKQWTYCASFHLPSQNCGGDWSLDVFGRSRADDGPGIAGWKPYKQKE
jgi:hypothetical protein